MLIEQLEKWCKENNTTISALEKKCGLGNATIRSWNVSKPRIDNLQRVADATGIPISELIVTEKEVG